jgi:general secretion pathway protein K
MTRGRAGEQGVILIALLWILTALAVIAMCFSRESFVEVAAARNLRDATIGYYAARAGIAYTAYQLIQRRMYPPVKQVELPGPPDPLDLGILSGTSGDGEYEVEIQDESGKINVNFVTEEQLKALMEVLGIVSPDADIIVDSIMDWRDVDNLRRANGAEDDYYQTLNPPYKAKNGRIETIEELLLVRGISKEYFYGRTQKVPDGSLVHRIGLWNCFTVYSTTNRVNVNFAPLEVLLSIPGMAPQAAQQILERRKTKPFASADEINRALPVNLGPTTAQYLSTDLTSVYSLNARGKRQSSKAVRLVRSVIFLDPREPSGYRTIYWNDNVPSY